MNDLEYIEGRMNRAEHDLAQAKSTIVQRELQLKRALEDIEERAELARVVLHQKEELREQLAQAQAACAEKQDALNTCTWECIGDGYGDTEHWRFNRDKVRQARSNDCGKGYLSPEESAKLQAQLSEREQEIAAIQTGIRKEFTIGEPSGDVLQDFGHWVNHHNEVEAQCAAMREALRDAQMHIEADNIDWSKMNEGPDHDPNYKPIFPEIVKRCQQALAPTAGQDLLARLKHLEQKVKEYEAKERD